MNRLRSWFTLTLLISASLAIATPCLAGGSDASQPSNAELKIIADTIWVLIAAFLVFFMNTGFGCLEAGFCRAKNATNILGKNFVVFAISSLVYWALGWSFMFGAGNGFIGWNDWFPAADFSAELTQMPKLAIFFFQLAFAATAATIVSGCVAERIHYKSFMLFTIFIAAISYPITGHWIWGDGGWLMGLGFGDFAGSTVVHSVGGWAGLAGILLLGPRLGKYRKSGGIQPIPGHSMALAFLGGMILWLGWFGFNPGSTLQANPVAISHIVVTTNLACAGGMLAATLLAWLLLKKPDFSMTVNGALAGLVAVTAGCAYVTPPAAVAIGLVGGLLVVPAVLFFDRMRIDDPVGALSVHLVNGIWGTLAVGLFAMKGLGASRDGLFIGGDPTLLGVQLLGVLAVGLFTFTGAFAVWAAIKHTVGIRVSEEVEVAGLDVTEMGLEAYNGFQVFDPVEHTIAVSEPRRALVPPDGAKRFSIVVDGALNGDLMQAWSKLCQPDEEAPVEFKEIYPHMTTVQANRFHFRGGDPESVRRHVEELFRDRLSPSIQARVE